MIVVIWILTKGFNQRMRSNIVINMIATVHNVTKKWISNNPSNWLDPVVMHHVMS